jgi:hypothetical protein
MGPGTWVAAGGAFASATWIAYTEAVSGEGAGGLWAMPVPLLLAGATQRGGNIWVGFFALGAAVPTGVLLGGRPVIGSLLLVPFLVLCSIFGRAVLDRARNRRLFRTGVQAYGTVLEVTDTATIFGHHPVLRLRLRIEAMGAMAPYEVTTQKIVPVQSRPRVGDVYPVWVDPGRPDRLTLDPGDFLAGTGPMPPRQPLPSPE